MTALYHAGHSDDIGHARRKYQVVSLWVGCLGSRQPSTRSETMMIDSGKLCVEKRRDGEFIEPDMDDGILNDHHLLQPMRRPSAMQEQQTHLGSKENSEFRELRAC